MKKSIIVEQMFEPSDEVTEEEALRQQYQISIARVTAVPVFIRFWLFCVSMRVKIPALHLAFL